jgi:hypothetical protein
MQIVIKHVLGYKKKPAFVSTAASLDTTRNA